MSFLGNIVKSIGTDQGPPPKPPSRPSSANTNKPAINGSKPGTRPSMTRTPLPVAGLKRKAEEEAVETNGKAGKLSATTSAGSENRKGPAPPLNAPKMQCDKNEVPKSETNKSSSLLSAKVSPAKANAPPAGSTKLPPSKGSYAELMARAKQTAEQRSQAPVGTITHQDTAKKTSKLAERRKEEQERIKAQKTGNGKQVKHGPRRSTSPQKKEETNPSKSSKAPPKSGYKGTMGTSTRRKGPYSGPPKKSRYDEYLGTDEEDNSDVEGDDEGGYGSEGSSDMEAGFDDLEGEDQQALRQAKQDDAREQALENQLKREKEERRRKLSQMADKRR